MRTDISTYQVSLDDDIALQHWNGVIHGVLCHGQATGDHLNSLLETAPDFAMGHAMKGLACLMLGRRELVQVAQGACDDAFKKLDLGGATKRERLWCEALAEWLAGKPSNSIAKMEQALILNPADTISMKLSHGIRFMLGDHKGMLWSIERSIIAHDESHPLYGYALGCRAFALEEVGRYAEAEQIGRRGLDFARDDAWGLHAVAHVYDMTHLTAQGIALIDNFPDAWSHCNNFRFHVWWHKALLHLDQGEIETVLNLYDTKIRDEKTDDYRDFSNASSLLLRLELEGVDVGNRWDELAVLAEKRSNDGCLTFADMHYMLALMGDKTEKGASRLTRRVIETAQTNDDVGRVMRKPGVDLSKGIEAFGEADYATAFNFLKGAQPQFQSMGGSHAQRDVFERLTIEAGLRAGRLEDTELLLGTRTALRGNQEDSFAASRMAKIQELRSGPTLFTAAE